MHDFSCSNPDDMINSDMAEVARYYKENEEGVEAMCKVMEDMRNETATATKLEDVKNIMETMKLSIEQAMDALKIPESQRNLMISKLQ